jgi:hypothetical protein
MVLTKRQRIQFARSFRRESARRMERSAVRASYTAAQYGPDSPLTLCILAWSVGVAGDCEEAMRTLA